MERLIMKIFKEQVGACDSMRRSQEERRPISESEVKEAEMKLQGFQQEVNHLLLSHSQVLISPSSRTG
jgi:hypothetical protein